MADCLAESVTEVSNSQQHIAVNAAKRQRGRVPSDSEIEDPIQRAERSSKYQITPGETILLCGSVLRTETVWFGPVELGTTATLKALARS